MAGGSRNSLGDKCYRSHFIEVQTEAMESKVICLTSYDSLVGAARLVPTYMSPDAAALLGSVTL